MGNTDGKQRSVADSGSSDTLPILETRVGMRAPASTPIDRSQPMYEQLRRHTFASGHGHGPLPAPPPRPAKGMERSNSLMERQRAPSLHEPHRVSPHFDATATDKLKSRIVHVEPKEGAVGVDMGATVVVQFDGDVKTVNEGKIVELPGIGGEVGGASPEGGVEQTDGNSFVFEGVALSRSAPLQHLTKTRVKGPRGRQPPGASKPVSASSERGGAETTRQTAIPPEVLKPDISKPEPFADNSAVQDRQCVGTDEQRGVVTKEQKGVDTEDQKGVVSKEQRGVVTEEQRGVVTEEQRGVVTKDQRGVVTKEQRGVVPEEQEGVVAVEQRGVASGKVSWGLSADVAKGAKVFPVEVMERIQSTLREKRRKCGRPDELHEMSWEQLLDEKKSVQTAILQFEKQHGRPDTKAGKDIMKPIYHQYRDIKKRISEGRVAHEAAWKSSPSPEHSALEATLPNVTLSHSLPPQLWREGGSKVASEVVAQRGLATPTGWGPNPTSTSGQPQETILLQVICTSMQPPVSVRGKTIHNANTNRVEFVPNHSLLPKHNYEVQLAGQAITTTFCSNPANITSHSWSFETQAPPPRNLKVKLSGEEAVLTCHITDEMYFDLYKSLVEWGVRRFGISGEYIREISTTDANGFDLMIQADRDILGISDQQIVVFDVKD